MTAGDPDHPYVSVPSRSRRRSVGGSVAASVATVLAAACAPSPSPSPSPIATPSPTPSPTPAPPTSYFDALAELREAVRGSPDHLVTAADRVVATADAAAITALVRGRIATYPASFAGSGFAEQGRRWGPRAT